MSGHLQPPDARQPARTSLPKYPEQFAPRASARSRGRRWRRPAVGISAGTGILLAVSLLALAPFAAGSGLGVVLKHPYVGAANAGTNPTTGPGSCIGSYNFVLTPGYFDLKSGRGGAGFFSATIPCTSWISQIAAITSYFGMNTSAFTPAAGAAHDHIKVRWSLDYSIDLNTTFGGPGNTSYAYADVQVDAVLVDVTTSTATNAGNIFYNSSYLFDRNGTIFFTVYPTTVTELIVASLIAGDSYVIETLVTCQTGALVYGPVGPSASGIGGSSPDSAYAQLTFPGNPAGAILSSISY
jgi:hypothetical protein